MIRLGKLVSIFLIAFMTALAQGANIRWQSFHVISIDLLNVCGDAIAVTLRLARWLLGLRACSRRRFCSLIRQLDYVLIIFCKT